jgi:2',3'-cyclic-nucleotide 2'-phosphodiesterase (5'-nucleotidase family)
MNVLGEVLQAITDHKNELAAVVVHLNDTYLIEKREDRKLPGFARLIATIRRLWAYIEKETGEDLLLVVHSGDFLSPSLVSKEDKGEAMVKLLNMARVNYCVLGNHEFDYGAEVLADRLREANFQVLLSNATDLTGLIKREDPYGPTRPIKIRRGVVWREFCVPMRILLTGVVSVDVQKSFVSPVQNKLLPRNQRKKVKWTFTHPSEAVIQVWNEYEDNEDAASDTKAAFSTNVPFRIVLTHATQDEDRQLRRQIPDAPRTYILGGHDHDIEYADDGRQVPVMKNLANAETVRVTLLLAGGKSVYEKVYAAYARLQKRASPRTLRYPEDLEAVLLTASDLDSDVLRDRIKNAAPGNLEEAIIAAKSDLDDLNFVLRYDDHEPPAEDADEIIQEALGKVKRDGDDDPVCDFSAKTKKLDARDGHIRKEPTNMGVFVAECVRRQAGAQVAIINSGAFRCDSELEAKLSVRDLRETFLYDADDAIMVLEVEPNVVAALIKHGRQPAKLGTGAFPQIAGDPSGATGKVRLAISSYLLTRSDSIDGYDAVLHEVWGVPVEHSPTVEETRKAARKASAAEPSFSIVKAVTEQGQALAAHPPEEMFDQPAGQTVSGTDQILGLLQTYAAVFREAINPKTIALGSDEGFERWLGTDAPIAEWPEIQQARDKVRAFLRQLPAVAAYYLAEKDDWLEAWTVAEEELVALQKALEGHDFKFPYATNYAWMFDLAARGIPGWFRPYPD